MKFQEKTVTRKTILWALKNCLIWDLTAEHKSQEWVKISAVWRAIRSNKAGTVQSDVRFNATKNQFRSQRELRNDRHMQLFVICEMIVALWRPIHVFIDGTEIANIYPGCLLLAEGQAPMPRDGNAKPLNNNHSFRSRLSDAVSSCYSSMTTLEELLAIAMGHQLNRLVDHNIAVLVLVSTSRLPGTTPVVVLYSVAAALLIMAHSCSLVPGSGQIWPQSH